LKECPICRFKIDDFVRIYKNWAPSNWTIHHFYETLHHPGDLIQYLLIVFHFISSFKRIW
jgi:hypothetical protein